MHEGVASVTAQRVAAHRLTFDRVATAFGRPEFDTLLSRDVAAGVEVGTGRMHRYLEDRTAFFDGVLLDGLQRGVDQVVVVGAGYDGRSLRFARAGVRFFEVDHPATQTDKRARLERLGIEPADVTFVAIDLQEGDLADQLLEAGLHDDRSSLFLMEGVASYLDEDVLVRTLEALRRIAAAGSTLAISLGVARTPGDAEATERRIRFRASVAALGEPIRNELHGEAASAVLHGAGWTVVAPDQVVADGATGGVPQRRELGGLVIAEPS